MDATFEPVRCNIQTEQRYTEHSPVLPDSFVEFKDIFKDMNCYSLICSNAFPEDLGLQRSFRKTVYETAS